MNVILNYLREVKAELSKVIWPKKEEIIRLTLVIFIIVAIVGFYLGFLDFIFTKLLEIIIKV